RVAGVSRATVSRVVNDSPRVSPDVRQAVERAIESLGYIPNRAARSLVTRRSDSVAVVITEPTGRLFSDPFFPRLLRGISAELAARDRQLVLVMPETADDERRAATYLTAGHVDGVLLTSLHGDDALPRDLITRGVPVVVGGRPLHGEAVSYVDVDNRAGARDAVAHLAARGRRTIATIAGPSDMAVGIDRLAGYRDGLSAAGLTFDAGLVAVADFTHEGGARAMRALLAARATIDGLFAASDSMAAGALSELLAVGRRVPEDVAIVGYDDSPIAAATNPPLTSVRQPIEEMGREMAHLLVESIGRGERAIRRVVLATSLVTRASTEVKARH
ncbi:MAG TPA: LacI family DNA-binding transcriptional regulator, partial [Candidatus Limnocylindrales bacterium]